MAKNASLRWYDPDQVPGVRGLSPPRSQPEGTPSVRQQIGSGVYQGGAKRDDLVVVGCQAALNKFFFLSRGLRPTSQGYSPWTSLAAAPPEALPPTFFRCGAPLDDTRTSETTRKRAAR